MTERSAQAVVRDRDRVVPAEPEHVLALVGGRARVGVDAVEQVPQVEVGVPLRPGVDVDVHQHRIGARDTGLLEDLSHGRVLRRLAFVDVAAGLEPHPEATVEVQEHAPRSHDDRRRGHVRRVGVLVEGPLEAMELGEKPSLRLRLPFVDRR